MHETIEALSAYVDDEVSAAERARIDAHLASCVDCASRKALLERASASLGTLPDLTPTAVESRRIQEGILGRTRRRSPLAGRLRPAWAGAMALVLVVAGGAAGSRLLRNHSRSDTTAAKARSSLPQVETPAFENPGDVRSFVLSDSGVKRALDAAPAPAAGGGEAAKRQAVPKAPEVAPYGATAVQGAPAPGSGSLRSLSPPAQATTQADSNLMEAPAGAPERSAMDCQAERQHDQATIRPVLARPVTYTGSPAWLLVYAAPPRAAGGPEQLAVYVVRRADCGVVTLQVVDAP